MTKQELSLLIDNWINIEWLQQEIIQNHNLYKLLVDIAFYDKKSKSWRAAYMLDKINDTNPNLLLPYLEQMLNQLKVESSSSKKRHFLKLLSQNRIPDHYTGFLFDYCLKNINSAKEPPAVRVHAMQILFNLTQTFPELREEVLSVIEHEMEYHSTAGIISRGKKLVDKLRKQLS
jgi:hypothetical protein